MHIRNSCLSIAIAFSTSTGSALADDCATVKSAMLNSGHTPKSALVTMIDEHGNKKVSRQVQTVDKKYVQTANGKWYAMNIAIKDLNEDLSGVQTCRRNGSESVSGESTVVYDVRMSLDGSPLMDGKVWVSSKNRILKSEGVVGGTRYTTEYDFAHVTPPDNAQPMDGK
jgi:hypothetical protein